MNRWNRGVVDTCLRFAHAHFPVGSKNSSEVGITVASGNDRRSIALLTTFDPIATLPSFSHIFTDHGEFSCRGKKLLANVTGSFDEELRLRNEYLVTENRILRSKLKGRPRPKDEERRELATIGKQLEERRRRLSSSR